MASEVLAENATHGRNDPCPCGSNQKGKRCHGDAGLTRVVPPRDQRATM
ncbi:MAG: hypothetical protein E6F95_06990 [Actinobacteria bacterium]|nr:MAG: hypothetical protein E6F95_06990 [Actinomycetota bacterium]